MVSCGGGGRGGGWPINTDCELHVASQSLLTARMQLRKKEPAFASVSEAESSRYRVVV